MDDSEIGDQDEQALPVYQPEDNDDVEVIEGEEISWEEALVILNNGEVETISQLHNLEVTLYLLDGRMIKTIEPSIDAIFQEIDTCGTICSNIIRITE